MKEQCKVFEELAGEILIGGAYKATKYLSDKLTIKATRKRYKGRAYKNRAVDIVFTVGKPNYEEREFIKKYKKLGGNFPKKQAILKFSSPVKGGN
jgi:hypothetical protein